MPSQITANKLLGFGRNNITNVKKTFDGMYFKVRLVFDFKEL
jgi:hypothetical protein